MRSSFSKALSFIWLIGLLAVGSFNSCKSKQGSSYDRFKSGAGTSGIGQAAGPGQDGNTGGNTGGIVATAPAGGQVQPVGTQAEDEQLTYPSLVFRATGKMSYSNNDYDVQQEIIANMDKVNLTINTTKFTSKTSQVNDGVKKKVGTDTFVRVPKDQLSALAQTGFQNESYVVFSKEIHTKDLKTATFSSPAPAFIVPAKVTRYENLEKGPITYNTMVTTSLGTAAAVFTLRKGVMPATLPVGANPADLYPIDVTMEIPSDLTGVFYELVPIPRQSTYLVDTVRKAVLTLQSVAPFNNTDKKKIENFRMNYGLCTSTNNGQVENFTCPLIK